MSNQSGPGSNGLTITVTANHTAIAVSATAVVVPLCSESLQKLTRAPLQGPRQRETSLVLLLRYVVGQREEPDLSDDVAAQHRRGSGSLEAEVKAVLWAADRPLTPGEMQEALRRDLAPPLLRRRLGRQTVRNAEQITAFDVELHPDVETHQQHPDVHAQRQAPAVIDASPAIE